MENRNGKREDAISTNLCQGNAHFCVYSKSGQGGGTFIQRDIVFEFASWISAEFKLYIITNYQRLKVDENSHSRYKE